MASEAWDCPCGVSNPAGRETCRGCGTSAERAAEVALAGPGDAWAEKEWAKYDHIQISTTPEIPGAKVKVGLGIVTAEIVLGMHMFMDIGAQFRDIFGGRAKAYEQELGQGKRLVLRELREKCEQMGGSAVVGVRLDYEALSPSMLMITAQGTAVRLEQR